MTYQGAPGDLIKAAVDQGAKGIIIAGAGAGATSGTQGEGIAYALEKGAFVVTTTRAGSGRIAARQRPAGAPPPAAGQRPRSERAIAGEDLAPLKARVLLMVALTKTQDAGEIQRMFIEY
jgi:L-asparaginase